MRLRNVLIVVNDMDRAIKFYKEIFGLQIILDQGGNVIMSEGLVLQDAKIWKNFLDRALLPKNNMTELYFEESDIEEFVKKLEESNYEIEYVNELITHSWGQKVIRFYDLDGNIILNMHKNGFTVEQIACATDKEEEEERNGRIKETAHY
jgi:catechol 2,3-dioxygenase-like lactoylglutathione lyase family enzyme